MMTQSERVLTWIKQNASVLDQLVVLRPNREAARSTYYDMERRLPTLYNCSGCKGTGQTDNDYCPICFGFHRDDMLMRLSILPSPILICG
jgi:hypothetical protein